ncbi:reverse transcriptase domain-containing protein [Tanacetum coccineum]
MRTRSSSNLVGETSTNPKRRNRRRSKQIVEPFSLEETPVDTMADQRTIAELLQAPKEGYEDAIVIPAIRAENFELKHGLLNLVTSKQFYGFEKEDPHAHIHRFKDLLRACPHYGFTKLHQLDTFYNALTATDQDSLNATAGGNLLTKTPRDALTIDENKSKVRNLRNKLVVSKVSTNAPSSSSSTPHFSEIAALADAFKALVLQKSSPPAFVKAVEEICVTCGGPHPYHQCLATDGNVFLEYRDNIQGYVSAAAVNYNQGNTGYRPLSIANQIRPPDFAQPNVQNNKTQYNQGYNQNRGTNQGNQNYQAPIQQPQVAPSNELSNYKRIIDTNMKAMQNQINNVKNELRNEMQTSIQASMSNQTNELKNMMASFFQMNTASSSGSGPLLSNTIVNPKGELKAITARSGIVLDGPSVPMPPPFINSEEDERAGETLTDPKLAEYTIKYQNMLKALLSNKEKLLELENTPLNENCSAVILKKLPEKLRDPGKFLIPGSFSELNCKALADLGASINLMPLSVWKKLDLSELISTRMTLELANRSFCTPAGIARDVFVPVGRFTFPTDFVIVDYESDPRVPLILGRPFMRTARALLTYSNKTQRESINMIDINNISYEDYLEDLFANEKITNHLRSPSFPNVNPLSGNTTSSSPSLTTSEISDYSFEEFADKLALIESFPPGNDDMTPEDIIREIGYLLNRNPLYSPNNNYIYTIPEMFTDEHTLDYSSHPRYDDANDDLFDPKTDNDEWGKVFYDDPFDFKENKIQVDTLTSTDNEDKVFNPGILVHDNLYEVTNRVTPDKNVKKISASNASLILEDYNPPLSDHELPYT